MRIGIFGGSFDPVHTGHLIVAEQCREQANLDQIWFIPSAIAPHKPDGATVTGRQRKEMLDFAIAGHEYFRVSDLELKSGGTSYTVDTMRAISQSSPEHELHLIIGGDSLDEFSTWRDPAGICALALPIVYSRPGIQAPLDLLKQYVDDSRMAAIRNLAIEAIQIDISSTLIRERIAARKTVRYLLPRAVEKYIQTNGLYSQDSNSPVAVQ